MELVKGFAERAPKTSSLKRHLFNICYTCGAANWKLCGCRPSRMRSVPSASTCSSSSSSSSSSTASSPVTARPKVVLPIQETHVMKSRSGARPATARIRRIGRDPKKKRQSGKHKAGRKSGCQRSKELMLPRKSTALKRFMYGDDFVGNKSDANRVQYVKKKPAARRYLKKRPAAK